MDNNLFIPGDPPVLYEFEGRRKNINQIADSLGKTYGWVKNRIIDGIFDPEGFDKLISKKTIIYQNQLYTKADLSRKFGKSSGWVSKRIKDGIFRLDMRVERGGIKPSITYQGRLWFLKELSEYLGESAWITKKSVHNNIYVPPKDSPSVKHSKVLYRGQYYSVRGLSKLLKKDRHWVKRRISDGVFKENFNSYPKKRKILYIDKYYGLIELSRMLNKSAQWVRRRVQDQELITTSEDIKKPTENFKCVYMGLKTDGEALSKQLGMKLHELKKRLKDGVIPIVKRHSKVIMGNQTYTIREIAKIKGRAWNWVKSRIKNGIFDEKNFVPKKPSNTLKFYYLGNLTTRPELSSQLGVSGDFIRSRIKDFMYHEEPQAQRAEKLLYKNGHYFINYEDEEFEVESLLKLLGVSLEYLLKNTTNFTLHHKIDMSRMEGYRDKMEKIQVRKAEKSGITWREARSLGKREYTNETVGTSIKQKVEARPMTEYEKRLYGML